MTDTTSEVDFHRGKIMIKLAQTYPTLFRVVLEAVQNAVDSGADNIAVVMDRRKRTITIADNGEGVTRAKFAEALKRIGDSMKSDDKLGQFGLGLISPVNKCEYYTFTSCAKRGGEGFLEWMFNTDAISRQDKYLDIPCRSRAFAFKSGSNTRAPQGTRLVEWRTQVAIHNYVVDKEVSKIQSADALKDAIVENFGVAMRRHDVSVGVRIINEDDSEDTAVGKAKRFSGKKLPDVVITNDEAGDTRFRLYLAKKSTRFGFKGKVVVGLSDNDYRFPFSQFAKSVSGLFSEEIVELFKSGVFEGEIIGSKPKLHDSRRKFDTNEALVGFCTAIEEWYREHGKKYLKEVKEERQGQRIQDLSLQSLKTMEALLSDEAFGDLRKQTIGTFKRGTVGDGHAAPGDGKVVGTQDSASISTKSTGSSGKSGGGGGHSNAEPEKERPDHAPFTAAGPKGQHRTVVKDGSRGLQFDHVALGASGAVWVLEPKNGTIWFNVENSHWIAASAAGDRELSQFQEACAVFALVHHTMPEEYKDVIEMAYADAIAPLAFLVRNSPSFNLKARFKATKSK